MIIKCIAIDDEPLALELLKEYISKIPFLRLLNTFCKPCDSIEFIEDNPVELLFLDIQMEDLSGFQLIKVLKNKPQLIFTTAFSQYAVDGYEIDAVDYLLKPISFERFVKAADKAYQRLKAINNSEYITPEISISHQNESYFFIKTEYRLQKVEFNDILFIEGYGDYLQLITKKEKILTLQNFRSIESILPDSQFCRVHKSFIVALNKIDSIEKNGINIGNKQIPISQTYRDYFFNRLKTNKLI